MPTILDLGTLSTSPISHMLLLVSYVYCFKFVEVKFRGIIHVHVGEKWGMICRSGNTGMNNGQNLRNNVHKPTYMYMCIYSHPQSCSEGTCSSAHNAVTHTTRQFLCERSQICRSVHSHSSTSQMGAKICPLPTRLGVMVVGGSASIPPTQALYLTVVLLFQVQYL